MAAADVDKSLHEGPYRPHITLGVWEEVNLESASTQLEVLASEVQAFLVAFRALGVYPGDNARPDGTPGVYLVTPLSHELGELHEGVHSVMQQSGKRPVHRHVPGRWEPHCTVAWRLRPHLLSRAIDIVIEAAALPLTATVNRIGLIDTPAEIELACFPLAAPLLPLP